MKANLENLESFPEAAESAAELEDLNIDISQVTLGPLENTLNSLLRSAAKCLLPKNIRRQTQPRYTPDEGTTASGRE